MTVLRNFFSLSFLLALTVSAMFGQNVGNCTAKDSSTRPDCPGAIAFFEKLQASVKADKRTEVAAMIQYPVTISVHGKQLEVPNQEAFLSRYDDAFNSSMLCAIGKATTSQVWGNYIGFTFDSGELWWEGIIPPGETPDTSAKDYWSKYPFKIIAFNNEGGTMNGCTSKPADATPAQP